MLEISKIEQIMLTELLNAAGMSEVKNNLRWQKYINTQHLALGIETATQRKLAKQGYDELYKLNFEAQLKILTAIFKQSNIFEIKNQCIMFLDQYKKKRLKPEHWPLLKEWVKYVDNWAHSDGLSSVFTIMLQDHLEVIYTQLQNWNQSNNPWERRQSLVCLFYYSRTRKHFLPLAERLYFLL